MKPPTIGARRLVLAFALLLAPAAYYAWKTLAAAALPRAQCGIRSDAGSPHPGMVWVPAGRFDYGDTVYAEEQPVRKVEVAGFWMDRTEVTNAQFRAFVDATGYVTVAERPVDRQQHPDLPAEMLQPGAVVFHMRTELRDGDDVRQWWHYVPGANWRHPAGPATDLRGRDDYPVVNVTFEDALAYAGWRGRDLPTEVEFEWAARGGAPARNEHEQPKDANTWQGAFPLQDTAEDGHAGLAPVACYKANGYGIHDLIGNVWELTKDVYRQTHDVAIPSQPEPAPATRAGAVIGRHVIKGGSYLCAPNYCMRYRPGARQGKEDDLASNHVGFRTVLRGAGPAH